MSELYPLLMLPAFDPRPWGTLDLSPIYPNHRFGEKIGEAWLTGDQCKVANGPLGGKSLAELSSQYGRKLVGDAAREPNRFPLLVKFLFPHEKLSVQVHPDDEAARRVGQPWGKTECWYVLAAEPGAKVALGLKPGITRDRLRDAILQTCAEELLNWIDVKQGEMIYVDGGTVHTIGPGSVLVEIQQSSDTTYRMYDYGRPRELHIEEALAATKERTRAGKVVPRKDRPQTMVCSPCFVVEKISASEPSPCEGGRLNILVALEGSGVVTCGGRAPVPFARGDAVVVPAVTSDSRLEPKEHVEFLRVTILSGNVPEPETVIPTSG